MALMAKRSATDPTEVEMPRRADDTAWRTAHDLLIAFRDRLERLRQERTRLVLERELAERPSGARANPDDPLRMRLEQLRKLPPLSDTAPISVEAPSNAAIALGLEVLAGKSPAPRATHAERAAELDRQLLVLDDAILAQTQVVADADDSFNHRASEAIVDAWNARVLAIYRAERQLAGAAEQFRNLRVQMANAGIRGYSTLLRIPDFRAAVQVGSEVFMGLRNRCGSPATRKLGAHLDDRGVVRRVAH